MANLANIHWLVPDDPIASLQQLQQLPDPPYHPSNITVIRTVPLLSKANLAILFVRKANSIVRDIEIPFMANDDATEKFLRFYAPLWQMVNEPDILATTALTRVVKNCLMVKKYAVGTSDGASQRKILEPVVGGLVTPAAATPAPSVGGAAATSRAPSSSSLPPSYMTVPGSSARRTSINPTVGGSATKTTVHVLNITNPDQERDVTESSRSDTVESGAEQAAPGDARARVEIEWCDDMPLSYRVTSDDGLWDGLSDDSRSAGSVMSDVSEYSSMAVLGVNE